MSIFRFPRALRTIFAAIAMGFAALALCLSQRSPAEESPGPDEALRALGETLFFDPNLSKDRTQSCSTCHDPEAGFADGRRNETQGALSTGQDGKSLGARNAPTVSYAFLSPTFGRTKAGDYVGGQFHDGRAATLEAQAVQPMLNPVEMQMPDAASVVARLRESDYYMKTFADLFGPKTLEGTDTAVAAMTQAIAAYERSPAVSPFDSKYDRFLRGEYKMTDQEELGRVLFFSNQFTNCHLCHKLTALGDGQESFTNFSYHNIGVPRNPAIEGVGAVPPVDYGLLGRNDIEGARYDGQFKVPTLRNVAVTGPYMHNGVFKDLRTVILFYDKFNSSSPKRQINPETGQPWGPPEVSDNLSLKELTVGPPLKDRRIDALVAFLKTLTDRRYEPLLKP